MYQPTSVRNYNWICVAKQICSEINKLFQGQKRLLFDAGIYVNNPPRAAIVGGLYANNGNERAVWTGLLLRTSRHQTNP